MAFKLLRQARALHRLSGSWTRCLARHHTTSSRWHTQRRKTTLVWLGGAMGVGVSSLWFRHYVSAEEQPKLDWKDSVKANYENRIRFYSSPDKVFSTFASKQNAEGEWFMTLDDFVNAILPSSFMAASEKERSVMKVPKFFNMIDFDGDGLISYGEFIFFITMLGIPQKLIHSAFYMFDQDGSGGIDKNEFSAVMDLMLKRSPAASLARGFSTDDAEHVFQKFFAHGSDRVSLESFRAWLNQLHDAVQQLEFNRFDLDNDGTISMQSFGVCLVGYASPQDVPSYLKRAATLYGRNEAITMQDYRLFNTVMEHLDDIVTVVQLFSQTGAEMCRSDFKRAVRAVTNEDISDSVVETLFVVFDKDGDGTLDYEELVGVLSKRKNKGLDHSRDVGFFRVLNCCKKCVFH